MTIFPSRRLLLAAAALTAASALLAGWPWLLPSVGAAAVGLLALTLLDLRRLRRTPALRFRRELPERAFVGREASFVFRIANPGDAPRHVVVHEDLPPSLGAETTTPLERTLAPGAAVTHTLTFRPTERGDARFGPAVLLEEGPLRLLLRRSFQGEGDALRVYPDTSRLLRPEALDPRRVAAALGARPARPRGGGMEFESLRDWVPGDDPRWLDWAASARRGRPVVRLHQHEKSQTVILALDSGRLMAARSGGRSKLDFAVDAALGLACAALATGDRVGLVVFDSELRAELSPRGRRASLGDFIEALRTVMPRLVESEPDTLLRHLARRRQQRSLVVLLTDFVEAAPARLVAPLSILARHHQVLLVALRDAAFDVLDPRAPAGASPERHGLERRIVLHDLLRERETALGSLRRSGLHTLDLRPEAATAAVLNRYLALRAA